MDNDKEVLVSVTFIASASPYHADDVAGFPAKVAKDYVDKQVARYTNAEDAPAAEGTGLALGAQGQASNSSRTRSQAAGKVRSKPKDAKPDEAASSDVAADLEGVEGQSVGGDDALGDGEGRSDETTNGESVPDGDQVDAGSGLRDQSE